MCLLQASHSHTQSINFNIDLAMTSLTIAIKPLLPSYIHPRPHQPFLPLPPLQTLTIPTITSRTRPRTLTRRRPRPPLPPTLSPMRNRPRRRLRRLRHGRRGRGGRGGGSRVAGELAIHKGQRALPVLGGVALVRVRVVAVAAVGVSGVAVALDFGGGGALEARGAGGELFGWVSGKETWGREREGGGGLRRRLGRCRRCRTGLGCVLDRP